MSAIRITCSRLGYLRPRARSPTGWPFTCCLKKCHLLYGSGVVPNRFEDFKTGIHALIMNQFFTSENIEKFLADQTRDIAAAFDPDPVLNAIDYDRIFSRLVEAVMASPFGGMLNILGGSNALHPLKESFIKKIRTEIHLLLTSPKFLHAIQEGLGGAAMADDLIAKVDALVVQRLDELTPEMVKTIVQAMIRKHLGWLVVWGGVFGGLIGLMTSFV